MEKIFDQFINNFQNRFSSIVLANIGEDSLRYDFFSALKDILNLSTHEMQIEYPVHFDHFEKRNTKGSKRNEGPKIDLYVSKGGFNSCFEFAMFKGNVTNSPTPDTEHTFKMLNDFLRLGIQSHFTNAECYFICLAIKKMDGRNLKKNSMLGKFPAIEYEFDCGTLTDICGTYKSAKKIDDRFKKKLLELGITIKSNLILNKDIGSELNKFYPSRILIWRVSCY